jgi:hypothetical protein
MSNVLYKMIALKKEYVIIMKCKGCNKSFPGKKVGTQTYGSLDYYIHCIEKCRDFEEKGFIKKCSDCKLLFTTSQGLFQHMAIKHKETVHGMKKDAKPFWMDANSFTRCWMLRKGMNESIPCKGCGKSFPGYKNLKGGSHIYSLEYYIHCIDQCKQYKAMGLIKECIDCGLKFISNISLGRHKKRHHHHPVSMERMKRDEKPF